MNNKPWEQQYGRYGRDSDDALIGLMLQIEIAGHMNLRRGDYVQVMREFKTEELSERCQWKNYMDKCVGRIGWVSKVFGKPITVGKVDLHVPQYRVGFYSGTGVANADCFEYDFWFPVFVLRKLSAEEIGRLNDDAKT